MRNRGPEIETQNKINYIHRGLSQQNTTGSTWKDFVFTVVSQALVGGRKGKIASIFK